MSYQKLLSSLLLLASLPAWAANDLIEVYQAAAKYDAPLQQARLQYKQVLELKNQANATLLPSIDLTAKTGRTEIDQQAKSVGTDIDGGYNSSSAVLSLRQPIYNQSAFSAIDQAELTIKQAETSLKAAELDLMVRSAQKYLQVLSTKNDLTLVEAEKKAVQRQLEQNEKRYEVGLIAITDVEETRARRDQIVADEITAQNQLDNAKEELFELTGQSYPQLKSLNPQFQPMPPEPANSEHWVTLANQSNLELEAARIAADIAATTIRYENAGHYPTLDLTGQYGYEDKSDDINTGAETTTANLQLSLNIPLYRGGDTQSKVREAKFAYEEAQAKFDEVYRRVTRQTRNAYRNVSANISQVNALETALRSAKVSLKATEAGFEVGTRTAVQLLDAQREVFRAERNYQAARYNYLINQLTLALVSGQLQLADLQRINGYLSP